MNRFTEDHTAKTKAWLDRRFRMTDEDGIYVAHQNAYGLRDTHIEDHRVLRYVITYQLMKSLTHLEFRTLLDVGGAEGYTAALVRKTFSAEVASCDLSEEACRRAAEMYGVAAHAADVTCLPYPNDAFDVVTCSETLEHVPQLRAAARELVRVSRRAAVITVPHDPFQAIERNVRNRIPHAHIQCLDLDSFDFLKETGYGVLCTKFYSALLRGPIQAVQAERKPYEGYYPRSAVALYNLLVPVFARLFGRRSLNTLIHIDDSVSAVTKSYRQMLFIVLKDRSCYSLRPRSRLSFYDIVDFTVPHHYLKG